MIDCYFGFWHSLLFFQVILVTLQLKFSLILNVCIAVSVSIEKASFLVAGCDCFRVMLQYEIVK